jgi:hypothetical protein
MNGGPADRGVGEGSLLNADPREPSVPQSLAGIHAGRPNDLVGASLLLDLGIEPADLESGPP